MKDDFSEALEKYKSLKKKKLTNSGSFTERDEKAAEQKLKPKICPDCGKPMVNGKCKC